MRRSLAIQISLLVALSLNNAASAEESKRKVSMLPIGMPSPAAAQRVAQPQVAKIAGSHFKKGQYLKAHGDLQNALIEFIFAAQENPRDPAAYWEQAQIFQKRNNPRLAKSSLEQALAVSPAFADARTMLIGLHMQSGNFVGAAQETTKLIKEQAAAAAGHMEIVMASPSEQEGVPAISSAGQAAMSEASQPPEASIVVPQPKINKPEPVPIHTTPADFDAVAAKLGLNPGAAARNTAPPTVQQPAPVSSPPPAIPSLGKTHTIQGALASIPSSTNGEAIFGRVEAPSSSKPGLPVMAKPERSIWRNMTAKTMTGLRKPMGQLSSLWPFHGGNDDDPMKIAQATLAQRQPKPLPQVQKPQLQPFHNKSAAQVLLPPDPPQAVIAAAPPTPAAPPGEMSDPLKEVLAKVGRPQQAAAPTVSKDPAQNYKLLQDTVSSHLGELTGNAVLDTGAKTTGRPGMSEKLAKLAKMPKMPHLHLPLGNDKQKPSTAAAQAFASAAHTNTSKPEKSGESLWQQAMNLLPKFPQKEEAPPKVAQSFTMLPPTTPAAKPEKEKTDIWKSLTSWMPDLKKDEPAKPVQTVVVLPPKPDVEAAKKPVKEKRSKAKTETPAPQEKPAEQQEPLPANIIPDPVAQVLASLPKSSTPEPSRSHKKAAPAETPETLTATSSLPSAVPLDVSRILKSIRSERAAARQQEDDKRAVAQAAADEEKRAQALKAAQEAQELAQAQQSAAAATHQAAGHAASVLNTTALERAAAQARAVQTAAQEHAALAAAALQTTAQAHTAAEAAALQIAAQERAAAAAAAAAAMPPVVTAAPQSQPSAWLPQEEPQLAQTSVVVPAEVPPAPAPAAPKARAAQGLPILAQAIDIARTVIPGGAVAAAAQVAAILLPDPETLSSAPHAQMPEPAPAPAPTQNVQVAALPAAPVPAEIPAPAAPSPVPVAIQSILAKVAPTKNSLSLPTGSTAVAPSPQALSMQQTNAPLPSSRQQPTTSVNLAAAQLSNTLPNSSAPLPQAVPSHQLDGLPPIIREIVQTASKALTPTAATPQAIPQASTAPQPLQIPTGSGESPTPVTGDASAKGQAPMPIPADLDKYLQNLMVPVIRELVPQIMPQTAVAPVPPSPQSVPGARPKTMVASQNKQVGAFNYQMPSLETDKSYLLGNQTRTIPPAPPKKPAPPPPEDPVTKRMRYLNEHGTGTLKPGEAYMYSEETGEGVLFLPNGACEKRKLMDAQDHDEVMRTRRPDIIEPRDLQYSLNLLGKMLQPKAPPPLPVYQPGFSNEGHPQLGAPTLQDMMNQTQKGFWGWFKDTVK